MVTFAQAQERAERWVNGGLPAYQHREVHVREFDLGFVVWAEDRPDGPTSDGGALRLVIARDSGESTLWPGLPVEEVIRQYEEEQAATNEPAPEPAPPQRVDLESTSFLLSPPDWLQQAADQMGIPDRRSGTPGGAPSDPSSGGSPVPGAGAPGAGPPGTGPGGTGPTGTGSSGAGVPLGGTGAGAPGGSHGGAAPVYEPTASSGAPITPPTPNPATPPATGPTPGGSPWDAADTSGTDADDAEVALPATVFAPPISGVDEEPTPPSTDSEAKTAVLPEGSALPQTAVSPIVSGSTNPPPGAQPPFPPGTPPPGAPPGTPPPGAPPGAPPAGQGPSTPPPPPPGGVHHAATMLADPSSGGFPPPGQPGPPGQPSPPGPPGQPHAPGQPGPPGPPGPPGQPGGYPGGPGAPPGASGVPGPPPPPGAPGVPGAGGPPGTPSRGAGVPGPPPPPGAPGQPGGAPGSGPSGGGSAGGGGVHHAATMLAGPEDIAGAPTSRAPVNSTPPRGGMSVPPPPGAPGVPGQSGAGRPAGAGGDGGYVPTQLVSADDIAATGAGANPPDASGAGGSAGDANDGVHHAATMLADPSSGGFPPPGQPGPPGQPSPPGPGGPPGQAGPGGQPGGGMHQAATMLAGPGGAPAAGAPGMPPGPTGGPGMGPGAHPGMAPPGMGPGGHPGMAPPSYGYPQPPGGQPTVGPGYMAVLRYRAQDGSEQQIIRRSAPGTPHPEWQILYELRSLNVPPQQVLELHTELESCELPGGYCARMIRETWPQVRITHTASYGRDHASRQQGVNHLLEHQGELHQVADGPARPAPVRVPLPPPHQLPQMPPVPPQAIGDELLQAFGPQGLFRFDQRAVARQGVPEIVGQTLVWAGLPVDLGPFFWAQAQPGRPVPTLAELAGEQGVQPASDAGSYLVMGNDFGRQICVQYGTAHIVAVPAEGEPAGQPAPAQFVNSSLPQFARSLALLGRMWRLRFGLTPDQAGRWTVDFQNQLAALDPAALASPENWWSVLLEQMWDGLL